MRHLPNQRFQYSGLTVILDKPSRFDRQELLCGYSGQYFETCLAAAGLPSVSRHTVEIRLLKDLELPFLEGTKCLLFLGEGCMSRVRSGVSLGEQRGSPFFYEGITSIVTYAPQDADDRRDYFTSDDGEDGAAEEKDVAGDKTTHGTTQRKNWRFWMRQDIKKAARLSATPISVGNPNYHIRPDIGVVIKKLTETKGQHLYFDIETDSNMQMTCFGFAFDPVDIYVVPMLQTQNFPKNYYYEQDTALLLRALAIALRDNTVVIHNSMFDLFVLAWRYGIPLQGRVYDTMLAHNRCYIEVEKSLGHVLSFYTDLPYHKNEGVFEPSNINQMQQLLEYNGKDVYALTQLKPAIDIHAKRLKAEESVAQINRMVIPYLTMTLQGIKLSTAVIDKVVDRQTRYNAQIKRVLAILTRQDINPNSPKQVAKYLYDGLGFKRPAEDLTAEKTLLQLMLKDDVAPIYAILKYRQSQKRISKAAMKTKNKPARYYYGPFQTIGPTVPRITTSWRLAKTITMRLGSSKLLRRWGDNLQNWEKELRKQIIPDDGKCFLQADQGGAEALIVAYLCRPGQLRDLFLCNMNPHSWLAMHIFREQLAAELGFRLEHYCSLPVRELAKEEKWKEIARCAKASDDWEPERRYYFIAKQGNHSLNYDAKAKAFRLNTLSKSDGAVNLTMDQAQLVVDTRMRLLPELPAWHNDVVMTARNTQILRNLFGHPRVITQRIEEATYKELYAFIPQSTVGQITNYAIVELQEKIAAGDPLLIKAEVDVLQNNHDSVLLQCLPEYRHEVGAVLQYHLSRKLVSPRGEPFQMKCDLQWSMSSWGEMKELKKEEKG